MKVYLLSRVNDVEDEGDFTDNIGVFSTLESAMSFARPLIEELRNKQPLWEKFPVGDIVQENEFTLSFNIYWNPLKSNPEYQRLSEKYSFVVAEYQVDSVVLKGDNNK